MITTMTKQLSSIQQYIGQKRAYVRAALDNERTLYQTDQRQYILDLGKDYGDLALACVGGYVFGDTISDSKDLTPLTVSAKMMLSMGAIYFAARGLPLITSPQIGNGTERSKRNTMGAAVGLFTGLGFAPLSIPFALACVLGDERGERQQIRLEQRVKD